MDITITIDPLMSVVIFASAYYFTNSYVKENKRKNVASLKKHRIEILDKTLSQINAVNKEGLQLVQQLNDPKMVQSLGLDFDKIIHKFLEYYEEVAKIGKIHQHDFSVWATSSQIEILNEIITIAEKYSNELSTAHVYNLNNPSAIPKQIPYFDDFVQDLSTLVDTLRTELDEEISNY